MSNRGAAVLGVRLLALYLFTHSLIHLPATVARLGLLDGWPSVVATFAPLVLALLLWLGAGRIATLMLPQRTATPPPAAADPSEWYALAFAAVGLLVTIYALPVLLEVSAEVYRQSRALQDLDAPLVTALSAALLRLMLGLVALLGHRGFARLIVRLRTTGLQHVANSRAENGPRPAGTSW